MLLARLLALHSFLTLANIWVFPYTTTEWTKELLSFLKRNFVLVFASGKQISYPLLEESLFTSCKLTIFQTVFVQTLTKLRDILFGEMEKKNKGMHLIAWDNLCCLKNSDRKAKLINQSMLMKVGWGLINRKDSLWVHTLRRKYGCREDVIPRVTCWNQNSNLWRGVCKIWEKVLEGVTWKIGNGSKANFWKDCWYKKRVYLKDVVKNPLSDSDSSKTFSDFMFPNGDWDVSQLMQYLPETLCREIIVYI